MTEPAQKPQAKSDCYSAGERDWMEYGQRLRADMLGPLLVGLTRIRVSPDVITLLAGILGLLFIPLWLTAHKLAALTCLLTHVLLDGLDGPLARYQRVASSRGSFTDTFTDQLVVTGVTIAWMVESPTGLNIFAGAAYIFFYALVVCMAMVRNALEIPFSWLVRPRFFVYLAITIDYATDWTLTVVVLLICDALLAIKSTSGFFKLRQSLPGPNQAE